MFRFCLIDFCCCHSFENDNVHTRLSTCLVYFCIIFFLLNLLLRNITPLTAWQKEVLLFCWLAYFSTKFCQLNHFLARTVSMFGAGNSMVAHITICFYFGNCHNAHSNLLKPKQKTSEQILIALNSINLAANSRLIGKIWSNL